MKKNTWRSSLLLFLAACIWGMAFVSQSKGMDYMGPFTFNGVRSFIGFFVLLLYILLTGRQKKLVRGEVDWKVTLLAGLCCGLALTVATTLQQVGLVYTTVGKAGFITTLYIIFVPIAGIFFRKKVSVVVWVAAAMAAFGMYLLCLQESLRLSRGDTYVLLCAIVFTAHILIIDYFSTKTDGVMISCLQFGVCGILCTIGAFVLETPTWFGIKQGMGALLYAGVMSSGVAYTLQIVGQRELNPTIAALIMSLESVIATIAGYLAYRFGLLTTDQTLSVRQIVGCVIVFSAVILVQLPPGWFKKRKKNV